MGIGDWGLGIGDWGMGQIENFSEIENNTVNEFCIHSNNLILRKVIIT